jgi:hypothetical protein
LEHVLVDAHSSSSYSLWRGDTSVTIGPVSSLYEYVGSENMEPRLVGVRNGRPPGRSYVNEGAQLISSCGTVLGGQEGATRATTMYDAISESGATVFFTSIGTAESDPCESAKEQYEECEIEEELSSAECEARIGPRASGPPVNEVYARVDGASTVDISEPPFSPARKCTGSCAADESTPSLRSEALYEGASRDGSKVFFRTNQPLVDEDENATSDLYEVELEGAAVKRLVLVSKDEAEGASPPGGGAEVQGVVRISEDGSHVYFVAKGVLTGAANGKAEKAIAGEDNLYVFDTATGRTAFIGTLNGNADVALWRYGNGPAATTPDGRFLVIASAAHLTRDDTSGEEAPQIFEYDAQDGALARVSIGRHGAAGYICPASGEVEAGYNCDGNTDSAEYEPRLVTASYGASDDARTAASSLTVSQDGAIVVFQSRDSLTPQAIAGDQNVYEYRAGNVYLVSDGHDAAQVGSSPAVQLLSIDATGEDIFFTTADALVPQDDDTEADFYDARIDGGFPEPSALAGCTQEPCPGSPDATPLLFEPGSETTAAGGNIAPRPAAKPKSKAKRKPKRRSKRRSKSKPKSGHRAKHGYGRRGRARRSGHRARATGPGDGRGRR